MDIRVYKDINESHHATGYHGRTDIPEFHIFDVADTYPSTRQVMPPYRFEWFQIVLLENSADASLNINAKSVDDLNDNLLFASPEHVLAWVRGEAQRGYIVYFKEIFLATRPRRILEDFPMFRLNEINYLSVTSDDKQDLHHLFERLMTMFTGDHPYREPMIQAQLQILLYECKRLYDQQRIALEQESPQQAILFRFQQFINQHFLTRKRVSDYADLLAITPDYLGQVVRDMTGKTPLTLIAERVILEAQTLLLYSDLNISEIADYLGYEEPTHFGRFFRRHMGMSPTAWREKQQ